MIRASICCLLCIFLTGCWDLQDIEERGHVMGIALDLTDEEIPQDGNESLNNGENKNIHLTAQVAIPEQGGDGQTTSTKKYVNISAVSHSVFDALRLLSNKSSRVLTFDHLKLLSISDEIAESTHFNGGLIDYFLRDHQMRRQILFFVTEGEAKTLLEHQGYYDDIPALNILAITENFTRTNRMPPPFAVGELNNEIAKDTSFIIRKVKMNKDGEGVTVAGGLLFDGKMNKLAGELVGDDIVAYNLLAGEHQNGIITTEDKDGNIISFEVFESSVDIKPTVNGEDISFNITISVTGNLGEAQQLRYDPLTNEHYLKEIEQQVNKKIKHITNDLMTKLQEEYRLDPLDLLDKIRIADYSAYKKIKDNWDRGEKVFTNADFRFHIDTKIERMGVTGNAQK
ncbi:Ger(x)C family spore germination protein [Alteribacillus sp. HJP-4]|uniref:Ger(x)C family spore germination protein n=1 Tax=Alteribacillus sp. HJP-4 TaxID=2775394 RepID=UPI0035CCDABD